jgi:hypothetical protein
MAPTEDSLLDRAETLAKRLFERLGSLLEPHEKGSQTVGSNLTADQISSLLRDLERAIESNLRRDTPGERPIAPNRFKVRLTYEETSGLSTEYMEEMARELTCEVAEYMANRRYLPGGPIVVEVAGDVLARETTIKHYFESEEGGAGRSAGTRADVRRGTIQFSEGSGRVHRFVLDVGGAPAYVGRSSQCAVRIDEPSISRLHCSLALRSNGELVVGDLGSANGTAVDGQLLKQGETRVIKLNDRIDIGEVTLTVSGTSLE